MFGSKVPLGAARVRTTTGGAAAADGDGDGAEESAAPIVINGRIQALYDEIMRQEQPKPGDYGILQEGDVDFPFRADSRSGSKSIGEAIELLLARFRVDQRVFDIFALTSIRS